MAGKQVYKTLKYFNHTMWPSNEVKQKKKIYVTKGRTLELNLGPSANIYKNAFQCTNVMIGRFLWGPSRMLSCNPICGCHVWNTRRNFAELVQTFHRKLAAARRQSQPDTPEVTGRQRSAHHTAAQSCGRRTHEKDVTDRLTSKNPEHTTDWCSSPFQITQSGSHHNFPVPFQSQPHIQCRGPRPKAHWYMH